MKTHHRFADFLIAVTLLILLLLVLLGTPFGTQVIVNIVNGSTHGKLSIEGAEGTLLNGLMLKRLSWRDNRSHVELEDIKLYLQNIIYEKKTLNINQLSARKLNIYLLEKTDPAKKIEIPDIRFPLNLKSSKVTLRRLNIIDADQENIFHIRDMEAFEVTINNSLLNAARVNGKPVIRGNPLGVWLNNVSIDFIKPHAMSATGRAKYSHIQTGRFEGPVMVGGTLTDYELESGVKWRARTFGLSTIKTKIEGDYEGLRFTDTTLENEHGNLRGSGQMFWKKQFRWKGEVIGDALDIAHFNPAWQAFLNLRAESEGSYAYDEKEWTIFNTINELDGNVAGLPVEASGKIVLQDHILGTRDATISSRGNTIKLDGRITEPFRLDWDIDAANLARLAPATRVKSGAAVYSPAPRSSRR